MADNMSMSDCQIEWHAVLGKAGGFTYALHTAQVIWDADTLWLNTGGTGRIRC